MQHYTPPRPEVVQVAYTADQVAKIQEDAFRAGYGMGGEAYQQERRRRPFLIEDEALQAWLAQR